MAYYLSPLVDIQEIDLSTTIPAVATSIGVELLRLTYKGPEMKTEFVSSEEEMLNVFGYPTSNAHCSRDMLSASGFLKYGNKLYLTRVMPTDATFAGTKASSGSFTPFGAEALTFTDLGNPDDLFYGDPDAFADEVEVTDGHDMYIIASSRGAWGNNIRVCFVNYTDYNRMNRTAAKDVATEPWYPYDGTTDINGYPNVKVDWIGKEKEATYFNVMSTDTPMPSDKDFLIIVQEMAQGADSWTTVEVWNVSTDEFAIDDQGETRFVEAIVNRASKFIKVSLATPMRNEPWKASTKTWEYLTDGSDGTVSTEIGVSIDVQMNALGLYRNGEEIDVNMFIDGDKPLDIKRYLIEICETRKDCMCILDVPFATVVNNRNQETDDLVEWRKGIGAYIINNLNENTSYASVYGNWLEVYDKYNKKYKWIPASGHVAGIYAHTDDVRDPWWAPAGLNRAILTSVRRLAWNPKMGDRDMLYKNGINPIVSFAGQGKVVWGQKTMLDKSSAFNRVNVRRLFIVLEKAISTASKYFLFEPNDEITRAQLKSMIEPFLRDVKSRRGVYDFRVICDETNNTPERIDRNELWCTIFIKPTRAAEFIVLQFVALKTGASFEESAQQVINNEM